jgi:peptide subunit release factor 1 (eRF1)
LGVAGVDAVGAALDRGQVETLIVDGAADIDETVRADLVRRASLTGADVETVQDSEILLDFGGVGALLR